MIAIITAATLILAQDDERVFQYGTGEGCKTETTEAGSEIKCPQTFNERRAERVRKLPPLTLPGHSSGHPKGVDTAPNPQERPAGCMVNQKEFVKRVGQFKFWLQNQGLSSAQDTLTREAAYNVDQLISSYAKQVLQEAKAKNAYSDRDDLWAGDSACQQHLKVGLKELYRVTELVLDELNNSNRDLVGTGLNPYANKVNK